MELVFETLETEDVDMTTIRSPNMIDPIVNRNFVNTFNHHNDPNQRQHVHTHISQQYQSRPFQISSNFSPPYLK